MSQFDELVSRYKNMNYGNLSGSNPSAVRSLLDEFNDRTYSQVLDPSQVTYLGDIPQNQWTTDAKGNLVFGMPGQSVQGGLIGEGGTATSAYPIYNRTVDYGDPGYAGVITGSPITGEATAKDIYGQGRGDPLGEGPLGMGNIQNQFIQDRLKYQNPDYKGLIGGDYADRNLGDTFTFSDDLPYGQAYDQYGRVRSPEDLKDTWQAMLANSVKQIKKLGPVSVIKSLLGSDDEKVTDPSITTPSEPITQGEIDSYEKAWDTVTKLGRGSKAKIGGGQSGGPGTAGGSGAQQSGKGSMTGGDNPGAGSKTSSGGTSRF